MQDYPGAPGSARKGSTRTAVPAARGGAAAHHMALGHDHPLATSARLPGRDRPCAVPSALDQDRSRARHTRAPGHERPPVAPSSAAGHDRPRATPRAPGADVPPATTAGAPGQHRLSAVPSALDQDRSRARHTRAPGHERPSVAPSGAAGHDRPRATPQAPGHDVPLVTTARAPGHGCPCAAQLVPEHQRSQHAPMAPPGHAPARAGTSVPIATAPLPARVSRLLQERLSRITATSHTLTHWQSHHTAEKNRVASSPTPTYPLSRSTTHKVHPAQVPPRPRSCSTACTGILLRHPSRAPPPPAHRKPTRLKSYSPSLSLGDGEGPGVRIGAARGPDRLQRGGIFER